MLDGEQLAKLASSLATAATLSKTLRDVTAEAEEGGGPGLSLLADLLNAVPLQATLTAHPHLSPFTLTLTLTLILTLTCRQRRAPAHAVGGGAARRVGDQPQLGRPARRVPGAG